MKVIENFVHNNIIYKIGMDFSESPIDELLPFLEDLSADRHDMNNAEEFTNNAEELTNNTEEINTLSNANVTQTKPKKNRRIR